MMTKLLFVLIFFGAFLVFACNTSNESGNRPESTTPRIKKFSKLVLPKRNADFVLKDSIPFEITSKETIDSILLEYGDEKQTFRAPSFSWFSGAARTGNQTVRLKVFSGKDSETHYARIKFLSDLVPEEYTYRIIRTLPHNEDIFTQGLFFKGDTLIESNGPRGKSKLSKIDLETGKVYQSIALPGKYFAEGSTLWNELIILLTWTSNIGFIYDENLNEVDQFGYDHEGWGITTWGDTLIVSDGTEILRFLDPRDFSEIGRLEVYDHREEVYFLNELEWIDGLLYANVYQDDYIVVIDPGSGKVLRKIDLSGLLGDAEAKKADVLNGIAFHPDSEKIYVTGKLWPRLFEVEFVLKN